MDLLTRWRILQILSFNWETIRDGATIVAKTLVVYACNAECSHTQCSSTT